MYTKSLLAALVAAPAAVSALGNAIVLNKCPATVYLYSVSSDGTGEAHVIAPGGTYSEPYYTPSSGGVSMKMSHEDGGPYSQGKITQFEYTLDGMIWYDISNINGNPFTVYGMSLTPSISSCPSKICPGGDGPCTAAYNQPDDNSATGACSSDADTTMVLCSANTGNTVAAVAAPVAAAKVATPKVATPKVAAPKIAAPKPAATSAAAPMITVPAAIPVVEAAPNAGVFTTFVTQMITIAARDAAPEPTAVPMKRDESAVNMHKRAAHRHHFHRHGADAN